MKKPLLFLLTLFHAALSLGQISEYNDNANNSIVFGTGNNPEFIELNGKFYFLGNNNGIRTIYSIDGNEELTIEYSTTNRIDALTPFDDRIHFAMTLNGVSRIHRLLGTNSVEIISNAIEYSGFEEMAVLGDELYFSGKVSGTIENSLIRYDGSGNFEVVNTLVPGVDFVPSRFAVNSDTNSLFFFTRVSDFGATEGLWRLNELTRSGNVTTIQQIGGLDWIDFSTFPPAIAEFAGRVYVIGRTQNDSERFLYQVDGSILSRVNGKTGYSPNSFYDVQSNSGGTIYNGKLALFRSTSPSSFVVDKIELLSSGNAIQEFDLPASVDGEQLYNELNGALIFYGRDINGNIEYLYEFRESTIEGVIPSVRVIHNYLQGVFSDVSQRPYWGDTFNGKFYFYGRNATDLRTLHVYDSKIINYDLILDTQEHVNFFGGLEFEKIVGPSFSIQNFTLNGGTDISDLSSLSTLNEIPSTILADTQLTSLAGLENLTNIAEIEIFNNSNLENFCALQPWASNNASSSSDWTIYGNAYNPTFTQLQDPVTCSNVCTPVVFVDANLKAFFLDSGNASRILDSSGNPVTGLVVGGEVCKEKVFEVYEIDIEGGYNNTPISSLSGLEEFVNLGVLRMANAQVFGNIDLRPLVNLEIFNAEENSLASVTVSGTNSILQRISIWGQGTNDNTLTAINIEGTLPNLTSLDISSNTNLNSIDLTKTPLLDSFQSFENNITKLDFTILESAGSGNFFISDTNGVLQEIDVRNTNSGFVLANFELDATGHPSLTCVLVNQGDLATAQSNVANSIWDFDNSNVVGTACPTCTPVVFSDANLKAFFLDPNSASRILDINGSPVTGLVVGGEVCAERATDVYEIDLEGGYNNTPISSLVGLQEFTGLGELRISNAQLFGNIDLRPFINLEIFNADENSIASVTVSNANSLLRRISVFEQGSGNTLTAVNFEGTMPSLNSLDISTNMNVSAIDLTKTPLLDTFQSFGTSITKLDFTALESAGSGNFAISDSNGTLREIDVRNTNPGFVLADFELDATGHPSLTCVLVNQGDLATAQNNVANSTWDFDNDNVVGTACPTCTPIVFSDANLKAFFLDPNSASRILDVNGSPVTGLVVGGEVCAEQATDVYEIDLDGGYNVTPISSLVGLQEFTALGRLYIGGAQLTGNIDISLLTNLEEFEASGNEITVLTASSANSKLTRIDVSFQGTNGDVLTQLNFNGTSIPVLESLSLQNNNSLTTIDLTKTPELSTFRPDNTGIMRLDLSQIEDLNSLDTFYLKDEEGNGTLQEIDLRNSQGNFNVGNFNLDATGHPNLTCVLVNQGDLATAQSNVAGGTWEFDNNDVVKMTCEPDQPYEVEVYIEVDDAQQDGSGTFTYFHDEDSTTPVGVVFDVQGVTATEFPQYQVNITTRQNTAFENQDFEVKSENVTLTAIDGGGVLDDEPQFISVLSDDVIENQESFYIDITPLDNTILLVDPTDGLGTTLGVGETLTFEVLIRDSENPISRIVATDQTATEEGETSGTVQIGVFDAVTNEVLTNQSSNDISIEFNLSGNATFNTDYTALQSPVVIGPGASAVSFDLTAIDDDEMESTETIVVGLVSSTLGTVASGAVSETSIAILDNDGGGGNDSDNDGILDNVDNCPTNSNPDQADLDNDDIGDICDPDIDGDGVVNMEDSFPEDSGETSDNDNDGIGDNEDTDDDNDMILDTDDDCPLVAGAPTENGCPVTTTSISEETIQLVVISETCPNQNNGSFEVTIADQEYTFTVSLDGGVVGTTNFTNPFKQDNLEDGSYQVCLTVPELPDFEQCFGIVISTFERLTVDANGINLSSLKASFNVQGSKSYEVLVNDNSYRFQFENTSSRTLEIPVEKGQNLISITGTSDCQGVYTDTIVIGNVSIFPNPVKEILSFTGFDSNGNAQVNIFNTSGSLVRTAQEDIKNGNFEIQLIDLPKGIYLFRVVSEIENIEFKIIKE